jgi:hypothetical protein
MTSYLPSEYTSSKEGTDTKKVAWGEIDSYLAVLIVTLFGAGMTLLILHVINLNTIYVVSANDTLIYTYQQ